MVLGVKEPAEFARHVEEHPQRHGPALPLGSCARFAPLDGIVRRRRLHLDLAPQPSGQWTFYESVPSEIACTRYFGADVARVKIGPIAVDWQGDRRLHVRTVDSPAVDWHLELGATLVTRFMSIAGSALPLAAWRSRSVLSAMGRVAGWSLGVGTVKLTGITSNRHPSTRIRSGSGS